MFSTSGIENDTDPLYMPDEQAEFEYISVLLHRLQPWQRAAIRDICNMIDRGIIKPEPSNAMVRDMQRVIASHRAMHEIGGAL